MSTTTDLERLQAARIAELEAELAELRNPDPGPDIAATFADVQAELASKGATTGTLPGIPIAGTQDATNAGPAKLMNRRTI